MKDAQIVDYAYIAKLFEDKTKGVDFFQNSEVLSIKGNLSRILKNDTKQLIFLIGDPGVGKSIFLNNFEKLFEDEYKVIKFDMPFMEPVDFITSLIKRTKEDLLEYSLDALIKQVIDIYSKSNYIILIDEAQLLSKQMIEIIRILADSKAFWFLLAMHKHESKKILSEPQFSSRPHKVLELGVLQKSEYVDFITIELSKVGKNALANELTKRYIKLIYKLTKGNFRTLKKLLFHTFNLMQYALENNKKRYQRLSKCLITMAAIDSGILDV